MRPVANLARLFAEAEALPRQDEIWDAPRFDTRSGCVHGECVHGCSGECVDDDTPPDVRGA